MAYFPSGSSGMDYQAQWCDRCEHDRKYRETGDGPGCPVWALHLLWNYDACCNEEKDGVLHSFIPRTRDGLGNEQCVMFTPEKGEQ